MLFYFIPHKKTHKNRLSIECCETYWFETLDNPNNVYFGYWCFEAMALAKIYGVDTTRLLESDYFSVV